MDLKDKEIDKIQKRKAVLCIAVGTGIGLIVYELFLYFHIDIYGWNLGLIFAPLIAGYVETILANRIIGEDIGAISAFILFIDTTIYSFILKNPTLGWNFITAGSIFVILQAAFPTLINYILLVVVGGILSAFIRRIKRNVRKFIKFIRKHQPFHWEGKNVEVPAEIIPTFDEKKSNETLNSLDFYFITSSDMKNRKHDILRLYQSYMILEKNKHIIHSEPEKVEKHHLVLIKEGKDECLMKLARQIKKDGGNGILDLSITYSLIGVGGENIQITATGIGISVK